LSWAIAERRNVKRSGDSSEAVGGVLGVIVACPLGASSMTRVSSAVRSSGNSVPGRSITVPTLLLVLAFPVRRSAT